MFKIKRHKKQESGVFWFDFLKYYEQSDAKDNHSDADIL
jgi:hypothetical protein